MPNDDAKPCSRCNGTGEERSEDLIILLKQIKTEASGGERRGGEDMTTINNLLTQIQN